MYLTKSTSCIANDHARASASLAGQANEIRGAFDAMFADKLASESSWTGKPYRIRCDGEEVNAGDWFTALLTEHRNRSSD